MITIQDLTFSYKKQPPLFDLLSFTLQPGSITGLLGKNGAGKTSLLKLIAGLLFPQSGRLEVMAHRPEKRQPSFLSNVFFVPEEFHLPSITINSYIRANALFYPDFDRELMTRLLNEFELLAEKFIDKLSYGQKKKFLISFALATKCRLLVLDEPTNGLDIPSKALFRKVMAGALDENQLVLISTHQVKDVETLIDRIIILDNGKVILEKDMLEISSQLQFSNSHTPEGEHVQMPFYPPAINFGPESQEWIYTLVLSASMLIFVIPFTGATIFVKSPLIKTLFAVAIIFFFNLFIAYFFIKVLGIEQYQPKDDTGVLFIRTPQDLITASAIGCIIINLGLISAAYFKLKEKEV